jgi:hypothetical protein
MIAIRPKLSHMFFKKFTCLMIKKFFCSLRHEFEGHDHGWKKHQVVVNIKENMGILRRNNRVTSSSDNEKINNTSFAHLFAPRNSHDPAFVQNNSRQ